MRRYRPYLSAPSGAGLVAQMGGLGSGLAKAGKAVFDLGSAYKKQDQDDERLSMMEENQELKRQMYDKNQEVLQLQGEAKAKFNKKINPTFADGFSDAELGVLDLTPPKEKKKKLKSVRPNNQNKEVLYYDDGTYEQTDVNSKIYNQPSAKGGSSKKGGVPEGYVYAGNFDIGDDLDYILATNRAYFTDPKTEKRYVNVAKLNRYKDLANTEVD